MRTMVIILEQVCAEWLDMKRLSVRESTFARYQMIIQKHVLPELGKYTLEEISSSVVNSYTCRKLEEISTKTVRDICTILKSVLHYAEKEYGLHDIAGNMVLPKLQRTDKDILTLREQRKLETYLWEHRQKPRCAGILICLYTGLRLEKYVDFNGEISTERDMFCILTGHFRELQKPEVIMKKRQN